MLKPYHIRSLDASLNVGSFIRDIIIFAFLGYRISIRAMKLFFRAFYCKHQFKLIVRLIILKNLYIFFCRMERLLEFIELIERLQLTLTNVYADSSYNKTLLTTQTSKKASHLKVSQFFRCSLDSWDCTKHTSQSPSSSYVSCA